jgi:hypothetical protein
MDREVVLNFVRSHRAITRDWEQFHSDFDKWREGLNACDASSVQGALRQFAGRLSNAAESARSLPRFSVTREIVDQLVTAIEKEEAALRQLRDNWKANDPAAFEKVDMERSAAAVLRKEAADRVDNLQEKVTASSRSQVDQFDKAFQKISSDWDKFHRDYDSFRGEQPGLSNVETVSKLSDLVAQFRDVVVAVRELPTAVAARDVAQLLATAAEDEDLELRKLRSSFQKSTGSSSSKSGTEGPSEAFEAFDSQLVKSNGMRRQARQDLIQVRQDISDPTQTALADFTKQYKLLIQEWDKFHKDYDDWRRTDGGCDRARAIDTLGRLNLRFGEISGKVRELPRATFLRPLGELFVEAAEREEEALRTLRNTWRPFDAEVYQALDRERNNVGKLRRQVDVGVQNLLGAYNISMQDIR